MQFLWPMGLLSLGDNLEGVKIMLVWVYSTIQSSARRRYSSGARTVSSCAVCNIMSLIRL